MVQPLLMIANRSGATPQVYRVLGATAQPFGDALPSGAVETGTSLDESFFMNRVIQFGEDVYAACEDGVYVKTDPTSETGAWTQDHAFASVDTAGQNFHIHGPYQTVINDQSALYVMWSTTTSTTSWNAATLDGGTGTWSDVGEQTGVASTATDQWGKQIVYRGVWYGFSSGGIMTFDPTAGSFGVLSAGDLEVPQTAGVGIFNDRLFAIGRSTASGNLSLYEIASGSVNKLFEVGAFTCHANTITEYKHSLFPSENGGVMYAIVNTNTGGNGNSFLKFIDTAGTISYDSDLSNPVLPAAIRAGSGGTTEQWSVFHDQETTVGGVDILIYYAPDGASGSLLTQYVFEDEVTEITQEDSGGSAAWARAATMTGGGERVFTPGELHIEIISRIARLGGEGIRFKCYGDPGSADKNVEFRYNTETEVPLTLASLTGTATVVSGAAAVPTVDSGLDRVTGVEADNASVYEVLWDISTDGLVQGQRVQLVPRIFI